MSILNVPPQAEFDAPASVDEGTSFTLNLSNAIDPSSVDGATGFSYAFDCGGGSGYGAFSASNGTSCPTTDNSTRTVRGKIRDKDGEENEYITQVMVNDVAPTAIFIAPTSVNEGSTITLSLTNPSDPSSPNTTAGFSYAFDCDSTGYGTWSASYSASCPTTDNSILTVKGKIRDKDGAEREYSSVVAVKNVLPTLTISGPTSIMEGDLYTLALAVMDPGADTIAMWQIT